MDTPNTIILDETITCVLLNSSPECRMRYQNINEIVFSTNAPTIKTAGGTRASDDALNRSVAFATDESIMLHMTRGTVLSLMFIIGCYFFFQRLCAHTDALRRARRYWIHPIHIGESVERKERVVRCANVDGRRPVAWTEQFVDPSQ